MLPGASIGLQAVLRTDNFRRGLAFYLTGLDRMRRQTLITAGSTSNQFDRLAQAVLSFGNLTTGALVIGLAATTAAIVGIGTASSRAAIEFEDAFAGVLKTVEDLEDAQGKLNAQGEELRQGIRDLAKEIPVSAKSLANVAALGGQFGINRDAILEFTRVVADLGATTNLTFEEGANQVARFANILGTSPKNFRNVGSALAELGNNFATTESDILNFGLRIAGAGKVVGLSEPAVLAIGAAFSSVGVQAEAGGTAVQKALFAINDAVITGNKNIEFFAATAGLSAQDFGILWEQDAAEAFSRFVLGLGKQGDTAVRVLRELGLTDQRLARAFLAVSAAGDLLPRTMRSANTAFEANTALTKEAEKRYRTTASQITLLKNSINDVAITIGSVFLPPINAAIKAVRERFLPAITSLVEFLGKAATGGTGVADALKAIAPELRPLAVGMLTAMQAFSRFTDTLRSLIQTAIIPFVAQHAPALKAAFLTLGGVLVGSSVLAVLTNVGAALLGLVSPFGLVLAAVGAFSVAWATNWRGIRQAVLGFVDYFSTQIVPVLAPVFESIQGALPSLLSSFAGVASQLGATLAPFFAQLAGALPGALSFIIDNAKNLLVAFGAIAAYLSSGPLVAGITALIGWVQALAFHFSALVGLTGGVLPALAAVAKFMIALINPVSLVVGGLILFSAAVATNFLGLGDAVGGVVTFIGDALVQIGAFVSSVAGSMQKTVQVISTAWTGLQAALGGAFASISTLVVQFKDLFVALGPVIGFVLSVVAGVIVTAAGLIIGALSGIVMAVGPILTGIVKAVTGIVTSLGGVVVFLTGVVNVIVGLFTLDKEKIFAGWEEIKTGFVSFITGLWDAIKALVEGALLGIVGLISGFVRSVIDYFSGVGKTLNLIGRDAGSDFVDGVNSGMADQPLQVPPQADGFGKDMVERMFSGTVENTQKAVGAIEAIIIAGLDGIQRATRTRAELIRREMMSLVFTPQQVANQIQGALVIPPDVQAQIDAARARAATGGVDIETLLGGAGAGGAGGRAAKEAVKATLKQINAAINQIARSVRKEVARLTDTAIAAAGGAGAALGDILGTGLILAGQADFKRLLRERERQVFSLGKQIAELKLRIKDADKIDLPGLKNELAGLEDQMRTLLIQAPLLARAFTDIAGKLAGIASEFATIFEKNVVDPLVEQLGLLDDAIEKERDKYFDLTDQVMEMRKAWPTNISTRITIEEALRLPEGEIKADILAALRAEEQITKLENERGESGRILESYAFQRVELARQEAEAQAKLLELEKQRQQLSFLQAQLDLIELIRDAGLDAGKILSGITLGLDASVPDLLDSMTRAITALVKRANEELEAGSPSKVFFRMGNNIMSSLEGGLSEAAAHVSLALRKSLRGTIEIASGTLSGLTGMRLANASASTVNNTRNVYLTINPRYEQVASPADIYYDVTAALNAARF